MAPLPFAVAIVLSLISACVGWAFSVLIKQRSGKAEAFLGRRFNAPLSNGCRYLEPHHYPAM